MTIVIILIFIALVFDFYNGMNDAANSIATVVSTKVLSPLQGVAWAAFFNFISAFIFGVHVANTIGKGIVDPNIVDNQIIFSSLLGAIFLTAAATHNGLPISVSHAIIGGFSGAAVTKAGFSALKIDGIIKVVTFIFLSPLIGFILGLIISLITLWIVKNKPPRKVDKTFRTLQLVSAAAYSMGHGTNDAQKTMGIIAVLLFSNGLIKEFYVPFWVVISCHIAIALGTLAGGWKVIRTLGMRVTKLRPFHGFSAEFSAALTLFGASSFGIPVSTTHTITGSIIGVGSIQNFSAVKWGVAKNIFLAWLLTIPLSALFASITYLLVHFSALYF
ncbi:MAG: inorganic phosphate transporter [Ignavibacteria bacterium]|nr:inorganic phosphate transporter [Ignavibacteria bacterium]